MKYNILIFPAGTEIANEMIASLQDNKKFNLFAASSVKESHANFIFEEVHTLPQVTNPDFIKELNILCQKLDINLILGAHDDVCLKLSECEKEIVRHAKVVEQSFEVNDIVRFKDRTYKYFENILPVPEVTQDFPMYAKPKRGAGNKESQKISSVYEQTVFFKDHNIDDYIMTEYLEGPEYTIDCFSEAGTLKACKARIRHKTINGIASFSEEIKREDLDRYAHLINKALYLNGSWFFQMKEDSRGNLKLLEIAPRIGGTSSLYRIQGINFTELDILLALGYKNLKISNNKIKVAVSKHLNPVYTTNLNFKNLYIDFDDTLFLNRNSINPEVIGLIYACRNKGKSVILLTRHPEKDLERLLNEYKVKSIFDDIIVVEDDKSKSFFMRPESILIDDSFKERIDVIENGHKAFDLHSINLIKNNINE